MTTEIYGVTVTGLESVWQSQEDLFIPPANADVGGTFFPTILFLSDTDWDFLASALERPPAVNAVVRRLLNEPSVLDR